MKALLQALREDHAEGTMDVEFRIDTRPVPAAPAGTDGSIERRAAKRETARAEGVKPDPPALDLYPDARTNFDRKAEALLPMLVVSSAAEPAPSQAPPARGIVDPEAPFVTYLPDHAVQSHFQTFRDGDGVVTARAFTHGGMITGLQGEGYCALRKLAEAMQGTRPLRPIVGVDAIERLIFDWVRARALVSDDTPMCARVLPGIESVVADVEVILPLFRVQLAAPVQIGRVSLRTVTPADFSRWESAAARGPNGPELSEQSRAGLLEQRKRMQGFAAATLVVRGERGHALEVAQAEAEEAVSLLRLFSPAMLFPSARSFCTLWGRRNMESTSYLVFEPTRASLAFGDHLEHKQGYIWRIDADRLRLMRREGFDALLHALYEGADTPYRDEIRSAVAMYAQSGLRSVPAERLLAVLIPLESFLLRTASEPIAENVAYRLAFAIGETVEERRRILEVARAVYVMRGAYVHHRKPITQLEEKETLRHFLEYAWRFFLGLGPQALRYRGRTEYLAALDERKVA